MTKQMKMITHSGFPAHGNQTDRDPALETSIRAIPSDVKIHRENGHP